MGDFSEDEVCWSYEKDDEEDSSPKQRNKHSCSSSSSAWGIPSAPRRLKRVTNSVASHEDKVVVTTQQSSAPVNIPDWSKIYGSSKHQARQNGSWVVDNNGMDGYGGGDGDDDEMVPPHEWLAKKLARNQISSFSVCEGVGRTLKGRDLSKVRNAVLTKTGFLE